MYIKMDENIKFGDTETKKHKFWQHKSPIFINNLDINNTVVSNKVSFSKKGFKCFIGYKDAKKVRPLCIFLPRMSAYWRDFDESKYMSFFDKLLEKENEIWEKVRSNIKRIWYWTCIQWKISKN